MSASASYFVLQLTPGPIDPDRPVNIIVSGLGNDLGTFPEQAAAAKAKKIAATYPGAQILAIAPQERPENAADLKNMGYQSITHVDSLLTAAQLVSELSRYKNIESLNVYGHSGITPGVFLDRPAGSERDERWNPNDPINQKLVGHFTSDALVVFNGCNMGEEGAPVLSKTWGVPVAGAMTSTHFEGMNADGKYYWADSPPASCPAGLPSCYRMRPDNNDYRGTYGHYDQGLPNYEFFCASSISKSDCEKAMARSVLTDVSTQALDARPGFDQYSQAVREWLCPSGRAPGDTTQTDCMARLAGINPATLQASSPDRFYTPFPREGDSPSSPNMAVCTFQTCLPACTEANKEDCAMNLLPRSEATSFVDEYLDYLSGYQLLFGSSSNMPVILQSGLGVTSKLLADAPRQQPHPVPSVTKVGELSPLPVDPVNWNRPKNLSQGRGGEGLSGGVVQTRTSAAW